MAGIAVVIFVARWPPVFDSLDGKFLVGNGEIVAIFVLNDY